MEVKIASSSTIPTASTAKNPIPNGFTIKLTTLTITEPAKPKHVNTI